MSRAGFEPAINWTQTNHVAKLHYRLILSIRNFGLDNVLEIFLT